MQIMRLCDGKIKFIRIVAVVAIFLLNACSQLLPGMPIENFVINQKSYVGKNVKVIGVIVALPTGIFLCSNMSCDSNQSYALLSVPVSLLKELERSGSSRVLIEGLYEEHGFELEGKNLVFFPSRIVVSTARIIN